MDTNNKPLIIGITGPFGSGKSTAATFFESKGFRKIRLSSFLEDFLKSKGKPVTRRDLQDLANQWREENGSGFLAQKALDFIRENNIEKAVIDGIRNLGEVRTLKQKTNFILLGIVADRSIRYERIKHAPEREDLTPDLFEKLDYRDAGIEDDSETGLQVAKCLAISDYFINSNDDTGYTQRLEEFLTKI